jgi:hypothetical protein
MSSICSKKCVTSYTDGDLAIGEMTCIDRCTGKYMHAQNVVGEILQAFEASQAKLQQSPK